MSDLYNRIEGLCQKAGVNITEMCRKAGVPRSNLTELKMGRQQTIGPALLGKIAEYFGVSVDYLLGAEEKEKAPTEGATDEEVKFALFGTVEVSDDLYERVKKMARIAAEMEAREKGD